MIVVNPFTVKRCHREKQIKKGGGGSVSKKAEENNVLYRISTDLYRSWNFKERRPWLGMKMILAFIGIYD